MGAGIALLLSVLPSAAAAYDETWLGATMVKVTGSPLEFGVGENASLHANLDGSGDSDIFWFDEAGPTFAVFENGGVRTYGTVAVEGDELKLVSLPVLTGSGTSGDPYTVTSTWDAGSPPWLRVTEVVRYVEGSPRFHVAFAAKNVSGAPLSFRPYLSTEVAADFSVPLARSGGSGPGSVGLYVPLDGGTRDPNDPVFDGYSFGRATDLEPDSSTPWQRAVSGDGQAARLAITQGQALPASLPTRARWQLTWTADGQQHDRVIVWIDSDGDGRWDRDVETTRQSQVDWEGDWPGDTPGSGTSGNDVSATGGQVTGVAVGAGALPLPAGTSPVATRATLRVSRLAVQRLSARVVRISGRVSKTPTRSLAVALRTRGGKLLGRASTRVTGGRFSVRMKLRRTLPSRWLLLALRYAGDAKTAPLSVRKRVAYAGATAGRPQLRSAARMARVAGERFSV